MIAKLMAEQKYLSKLLIQAEHDLVDQEAHINNVLAEMDVEQKDLEGKIQQPKCQE